jgi:hypothetical protein
MEWKAKGSVGRGAAVPQARPPRLAAPFWHNQPKNFDNSGSAVPQTAQRTYIIPGTPIRTDALHYEIRDIAQLPAESTTLIDNKKTGNNSGSNNP